jgi:biotin transport system substrate-specific component
LKETLMRALVAGRLRLTRRDSGAERRVLSGSALFLLSIAGACLTGLLAQVHVRLPLGVTPVPFTGQVLGVLICGAFLGGGYGLLSQAIYVSLGAAGLPWFAGLSGGFGALQGVTGGYLIGFVVATCFLGACTQRSPRLRTFQAQLLLMLVAVGIIHFFGAFHLMLLLGIGPVKAFALGSLPFVAGDAVKILIAATLAGAVLRGRTLAKEGA